MATQSPCALVTGQQGHSGHSLHLAGSTSCLLHPCLSNLFPCPSFSVSPLNSESHIPFLLTKPQPSRAGQIFLLRVLPSG